MEGPDLERVDMVLRALCMQHELAWALDAVNEAVDERRQESVNPGSSAYKQRGSGSRYSNDLDAARRPQPEIRLIPLTMTEQVVLLIDTMLGVIRDLPMVEHAAMATLSQSRNGRVATPERITFADDGQQPAVSLELQPESATDAERRQRVVNALTSLRSEVLR